MKLPSTRRLDYMRLSRFVQRVTLRLDDRHARRSSSERGGRCARTLECSTRDPHEARALHEMSRSLYAHQDARAGERAASYAAVITAAIDLANACPDFANPPLNAIWAAAGRGARRSPHPGVGGADPSDADPRGFLGGPGAGGSPATLMATEMGRCFVAAATSGEDDRMSAPGDAER